MARYSGDVIAFDPRKNHSSGRCLNLNQLTHNFKESAMSLGTILLIVLILILIGLVLAEAKGEPVREPGS